MSIAVLLFTLLSCITAVIVPWLGVIFYYLIAVGQLAFLFPQDFGDSRSSLYITMATIIGLGIATATRQVNWARLGQLPNVLLFIVWAMINISYGSSPYDGFEELKKSTLQPDELIVIFNKIMLFYFIAVLLIDTRFKLICLITMAGGVFMYYTLWANYTYLAGEFWRFGDNGRLNGPLNGAYFDENYLAMLYVMATPIFYYLSIGTSSRIIRYGLWFSIPFTWHALFLTGSRGALVSLAVVCIYIFFRSYNKKASIILLLGLVAAIIDQSGNMLSRINDTIDSETVEQERAFIENDEDSAEINQQALDPRLISWKVGLGILKDHPILGIGPGNFMRAFPKYDDSEPHVAHNTFLQIAVSTGLLGGLVYLYFLYLRLKNIVQKPDPEAKHPHGHKRDYLDDLLNSLFVSFYCVAFFLDLMVLEILYFVILIGACKYSLEKKKTKTIKGLVGSIYRWKQGAAPRPDVFSAPPNAAEAAGAKVPAAAMPFVEEEYTVHEAAEHQVSVHQAYIDRATQQNTVYQTAGDAPASEQKAVSVEVEKKPNQYLEGSLYAR